jgi:hypothetical protein
MKTMKTRKGFITVAVSALTLICSMALAACGGSAAPASNFNYELSKDSQGVIITRYTGKGGKVVIPAKIEGLPVVTLGNESFALMTKDNYPSLNDDLTSVVIPASVKEIEKKAFLNCLKLTSVTFLGSGVVLNNYSFAGCIGLTELVFPKDEKALVPLGIKGPGFYEMGTTGGDAFRGCQALPLAIRAKLTAMGFWEP